MCCTWEDVRSGPSGFCKASRYHSWDGKLQIRVHRLLAIIDQLTAINSNDPKISDITSPVQNSLKLIDQAFSCSIVYIVAKKILLYVLVAGDHIGNIFHIINIGINILIHLLHDILRVNRGIFKNRIAGYTSWKHLL